jgi:hypothetical protein
MQITSDTKIVPIVFTRDVNVLIKAFAPEKGAFVYLYDSEYHKKGNFSDPIDIDLGYANSVVINCLDDIDKAAKLALSTRPALSDEFPAAVIRYNPAFPHHDVMYWHQVNKLGQFQPYTNTGWFDVPENGAFLHPKCDTDRTRIFHSPVDAIAAAYDQTVKFIGNLRREVKAEEDKIQKQIEEKKALIDRINKAQEV